MDNDALAPFPPHSHSHSHFCFTITIHSYPVGSYPYYNYNQCEAHKQNDNNQQQQQLQLQQIFYNQSIAILCMNRKNVFYNHKLEKQHAIKLSPKIPAKKPHFVPTQNLKGQSSSHMNRRKIDAKPHRLESPLYCREKPQISAMNEGRHILSEEQIRNSAMYKMLEEQIKQLINRQAVELQKMRDGREEKNKGVSMLKKSQFETKLQIWELKREFFDLKDTIEEEKQETERLTEQLNRLSDGQDLHEFQSQGEDLDSSSSSSSLS